MKDNIFEIIEADKEFFLKLISLHFEFTKSDIEKYTDILKYGDAFYTLFISDTCDIIAPKWGLCFNKNIHWTDDLKDTWMVGFFNPFTGSWSMCDSYYDQQVREYANKRKMNTIKNDEPSFIYDENYFIEESLHNLTDNSLPDELTNIGEVPFMNDELFDDNSECENPRNEIPLNIMNELDSRNSVILDYYYETDIPDDYSAYIDIEKYEKVYTKLAVDEIKELYYANKSIILLNESIWNNTLKPIFTKKKVFKVLDSIKVRMVII